MKIVSKLVIGLSLFVCCTALGDSTLVGNPNTPDSSSTTTSGQQSEAIALAQKKAMEVRNVATAQFTKKTEDISNDSVIFTGINSSIKEVATGIDRYINDGGKGGTFKSWAENDVKAIKEFFTWQQALVVSIRIIIIIACLILITRASLALYKGQGTEGISIFIGIGMLIVVICSVGPLLDMLKTFVFL